MSLHLSSFPRKRESSLLIFEHMGPGFRRGDDLGIIDEGAHMKTRSRKRDIPPVHPGELLRKEFLEDLDLSVYALAKALGIPRTRLNDIVRGRRGITADTALRLARYFGTDAQSWINLQSRYDLEVAELTLGNRLQREVTPRAA